MQELSQFKSTFSYLYFISIHRIASFEESLSSITITYNKKDGIFFRQIDSYPNFAFKKLSYPTK